MDMGDYLLSGVQTRGYRPSTLIWPLWYFSGQSTFTLQDVESMRKDYMIGLGLKMLKSPLFTLEWAIKSKNKEVAKYVDDTLKTFWKPNIHKVLRALDYGYSGGEVILKLKDNKICIHGYKEMHPRDLRVLTVDYEYIGFRVKNVTDKGFVDLYPPKGFWFAIDREFGAWYGRSFLLNVWDS